MSRAVVNEILDRSLVDEEFRNAIEFDPDEFLASYELSDDERAAIASRSFKKTNEIVHGPSAGLTFIRVFVFTTNNNNNTLAAMQVLNAERKDELTVLGAEILRQEGDRTEALKEMLAMMR